MSIDLRVGEVDPPSVIMDVVNLPSPVYLGFTITAYNYDDVGLYFQITGSGTGWTFSTVNLGLIGSGANLRQNLDNFCNRARPGSETSEQITLTLKAYTDSGYTNLKWTYNKTLDVFWIKSDDGSWTQDVLNNFDDGTVQGWAVASVMWNPPTLGVATDYVLSIPYSLRAYYYDASSGTIEYRYYKSFTTPNRNNVYAIIDFRCGTHPNVKALRLLIKTDTTVILYVGTDVVEAVDHFPKNRWLRFIVPLPKNTTLELNIQPRLGHAGGGLTSFSWLDDFRIISKD